MAPLRRFLLAAATVALLICLAAPPPPSAAAAAVPAAAKQSTTSDPMMPLVDMIGMRDVARRWVDQTDMVTIIKLDSQAAAMLVLGFVGNYPVAGGKVRDYYNVLLSNDHNGPWTIDQLEGKAAEEELVYGKLRYRLYIFRSGSFTNNGQRGWVMWAFSGCYPGWDGGNMVTFRPREECRS